MSQIQFFSSQAGGIQLELNLEQETVWLSHAQMAKFITLSFILLKEIVE